MGPLTSAILFSACCDTADVMKRELPFFSIIIPTYRRPAQLTACLRSLVRCNYPRNRLQVIVVDEGSGTPPRAAIAPFSGQIDLAMIELGSGGVARARNFGARHARGDYLAFIDDDCAATSDWLSALASGLTSAPGCAVCGRTVNALPQRMTSEASQMRLDYLNLHYNTGPERDRFIAVNNLAVPAPGFRELGGFDESFPLARGEERDFCGRWVSSGRKLIYAADAVVLDAHTPTVLTFLREHFANGLGAYSFQRARARRGEEELRNEPVGFYWDLVTFPFARRAGWRAPLLAGLIAVSQCASAVGYCWARLGAGPTIGH